MTLSRRVPSSLVLRWVLLCEIKLLLTCRLPAAVVGIHFNTGLLVRSAHGTGHGTGDSRHGTCHMAIELADHLLSLRRKILVALALSSASQHLYIVTYNTVGILVLNGRTAVPDDGTVL